MSGARRQIGVGGGRGGDGRDQSDLELLGHGKYCRLYTPWASEPLESFEWEATGSDF